MAKRKLRPATSGPGPDRRSVSITAKQLLDGPRPGAGDRAADGVWLSLRAELAAVACGHPRYDLRHMLRLSGRPLAMRVDSYREWVVDQFAGDPRVAVGLDA